MSLIAALFSPVPTMKKYRVTVNIVSTFVLTKDIDYDIEAEDEKEAEKLAYKKCRRTYSPDSFDADHQDDEITMEKIECLDDPDAPPRPVRCTSTMEMF